jgi:signal transduction histidine kinase
MIGHAIERGADDEPGAPDEAERLRELLRFKEEMVSLFAHDLKSPISAVIANAEFVRDRLGPDGDPEAIAALHESRDAARRCVRMIANMLDVARLESTHVEVRRDPTPLRRLVASILEQQRVRAAQRDVALEIDVPDDLVATVDADMIARLVENVLDNALRYAPGGGGGRVVVRARGGAGRVELGIGDNGPPVPEPVRRQIFERFAQLGRGGQLNVGLGLYFCRLAAEAHGGTIRVERTADLPALFVVELVG